MTRSISVLVQLFQQMATVCIIERKTLNISDFYSVMLPTFLCPLHSCFFLNTYLRSVIIARYNNANQNLPSSVRDEVRQMVQKQEAREYIYVPNKQAYEIKLETKQSRET